MHSVSAGRKNAPIDVDELFDGVEEVKVSHESRKPAHRRPWTKQMLGSSSQYPIALDDDSDGQERDSIAVSKRSSRYSGVCSSSNANASGSKGPDRTTPGSSSRGVQTQHVSLTRDQDTTTRPIPMPNLRLQDLEVPASSPSPTRTALVAGPSQVKQELKHSYDLIKDHDAKMDIDSTGPIVTTVKVEEESSSDDEFWEWSDWADSDRDEPMDYRVDIEEPLKKKFGDAAKPRNPSTNDATIKAKVMLKAESATMRIPLQDTHKHPKKHRIWNSHRVVTRFHAFPPLTTDYRRVIRPRTGVLTKRTYLPEHNVFNCWLSIPVPRLSMPHFKDLRTSGSTNKIVQSHEFIAVASPTAGGGSDPDTSSGPPEVSPYNREGNLLVFRDHKYLTLDGHSRNWPVEEGSLRPAIKYYTVNDVAFDPLRPNRLVSSGCDRRVRIVDLELYGDTFSPRDVHAFEYSRVPYDILFKPNSSLFAVSCYDGNIYFHKDDDRLALEVSNGRDSRPGTCIWGAKSFNGALSNKFFVSTESDKANVCRHTAFDVAQQCGEYELDINDSGDAMALDPEGRTLALVTSIGSSLSLSLFDVGHNDGARVAGTRLHALRPDTRINRRATLESTHASFSPDGIFLAIARNDHRTHVYDVRFLSDKPIAELVHPPIDRPRNDNEEYGVTGLYWVEGWNGGRNERGGIGLVTAGADDCVRLWDVSRTPQHVEESMVLAQTEIDVACFSVGDIGKNERKLVVGDCAGEVYIFD